jgi:hypothetical protein
MSRIMVDELSTYGVAKTGQAARVFGAGKQSCHLMIEDGDVEELHAFAAKIGMRRSWFHDSRGAPHYDLTPIRRDAALRAGAVFVPAREQAMARRAKRAASAGPVAS